MRSNFKLLSLLLILSFFSLFSPFKETMATPNTNQRLIPFIGMVVDYKLNVKINKMVLITLNWTVTWEQYNATTPSIFISNLTIKSLYITLFTFRDHESGTIIENITSRRVLDVRIANTTFLKLLFSAYYSPNQPNFSPFYINPTDMDIGNSINIYSFTFTVISTNRTRVADFGRRDIWIVQTRVIEDNIETLIRLEYDNRTGVLVGGRIKTRNLEDESQGVIVEIFCQYTNALERHLVIIETNRILVVLVSFIPIIPSLVRILRMKEIKGGL